MPIGKNSIKRVANNGYSNLASSAPDMENSIVCEEEKKAEMTAPVSKKEVKSEAAAPECKKETPKKCQKSTAKKPAPQKEIKAEEPTVEGDYINLGEQMPIYLL